MLHRALDALHGSKLEAGSRLWGGSCVPKWAGQCLQRPRVLSAPCACSAVDAQFDDDKVAVIEAISQL